MKLIVTIDVEEDNWGHFISEGYTLENIKRIPELQDLFDQYGVKPTYLINYPVATDPYAIDLFTSYLERNVCEVGMHCHPWNTPPVVEEINERNSMLCNLPEELVYQKLSTLYTVIHENLCIHPTSFRAGRWGFSPAVGRALLRLGVPIDSSVTPYTDWGEYFGPDYSGVTPDMRIIHPAGAVDDQLGSLLQVPVTIGFLQTNFDWTNALLRRLQTSLPHRLHVPGLLKRLRLLNKVWLSPENFGVKDMKRLSRRMIKNNYTFLNMFFHSVSLQAGSGPFTVTSNDKQDFIQRIRKFLEYASKEQFRSVTLSEMETDVGSVVRYRAPALKLHHAVLKGSKSEESDTRLVH